MDPTSSAPNHHSTRIRNPSSRLRGELDPLPKLSQRRLLPVSQSPFPPFPPENVVLHPEDATSKVLAAIVRSLLSVDNRAMTIKDLTEKVSQFGLACQNLSATSQAVTTYIRSHLQRCEAQEDQPLLLRHVLSGTIADDDLLPALYSRSGGHVVVDKNKKDNTPRATNFRKGTMVWYLSRVIGAPCPFARAGIRLCDYVETEREQPSDGKRKKVKGQRAERESKRLAAKAEEEQRGLKRKRDPLAYNTSDDENSSPQPPPPTRIKLTLKLRAPTHSSANTGSDHWALSADTTSTRHEDSSSDEDEDQHDAVHASRCILPPYPRRSSISIPPYTPSIDFQSCSSYPSSYTYRRSPSVPYSVASMPPDSGDEYEDDWFLGPDMDRDEDFSDFDAMSAQGSSPRSPSAPPLPLMVSSSSAHYFSEPRVKEEPTDVQGILDAWEGLDHFREAEYGKPFVADLVEFEREDDAPDWESESPFSTSPVKLEDVDVEPLFSPSHSERLNFSFQQWRSTNPFSADGSSSPPISPTSPVTEPDLFSSPFESPTISYPFWKDGESVTVRPRAKTVPSLPSLDTFFQTDRPSSPLPAASTFSQSLTALIESLTVSIEPPRESIPVCISPKQMDIRAWGGSIQEDSIVVKTCWPCDPEILATQVEGITVYQMKLGAHVVLRRIDTDFVNLSPIVNFLRSPSPVITTIPNAIFVKQGTELIQGLWVPLSAAQAFTRDHPVASRQAKGLELFLCDSLVEQFPSALRDFVSNVKRKDGGRLDGQFGKGFGSMVQAREVIGQVQAVTAETMQPLSSSAVTAVIDAAPSQEVPLSPSEQELFQAFVVSSEWDKENVGSAPAQGCNPTSARSTSKPLTVITSSNTCSKDKVDMDDEPLTPIESSPCSARSISVERSNSGRPLRRSKRVQDAATRSKIKTRSRNNC